MAGKRTTIDNSRIALTLWRTTVLMLREISDQTGKPQTELAHEAILLLQEKYHVDQTQTP